MTKAEYLKLNSAEQLAARKEMGHRAYLTMMRGRELTQKEKEEGRAGFEKAVANGTISTAISRMIREAAH